MVHNWAYWVAISGGIGLLPAPGTMGTILIGIPLVLLWNYSIPSGSASWSMLLVISFIAVKIITRALYCFPGLHDPQVINLDEVIGLLWALHGLSLSPQLFTAAVILFRFFDIVKQPLIYYLQSLPGAWGILADDILAGIYVRIILLVFFV